MAGPRETRAGAQAGFTLLELVIVVVLVSVLIMFAVDRLAALRVEAERVAMERTLGSLRSAVGLDVAEHILEGRVARLPERAGDNPIGLLQEPPVNYAGAFLGAEPPVPPGSWYFDLGSRELVYLPRAADAIAIEAGDRLRFALRLVYEDRDGDGAFDADNDRIRGLQIVSRTSYSWPTEPMSEGWAGKADVGPRGAAGL
ncbi:prepilin-type N-terminal cleavage/methylation domain-containing protein [Alkalilimnicola sp. S0819]|uniref:prepilin-type N-terminal cleavage/methylation domain-containing protein n=1 Tax=Alkalilimnicola sp. S0819 TaxID=2613922 RepID=UPI001261DB73|nr:prepilin-type N-terminal cleavage/methylation domain-containing protein [Alkalilimnicola sp. S0819]KAB7622636.1 prepilin-type N-terminal cleavage/methylation domain-containing protein [Alkalilimnicola sp. S0819]MPQ17407.1 prepilin-type N-terminal cleavage/methylation domain-containing protein [Alkalilimnicola sp. S0819]